MGWWTENYSTVSKPFKIMLDNCNTIFYNASTMTNFDPKLFVISLDSKRQTFGSGVDITVELWYDGDKVSESSITVTKNDVDNEYRDW